MTIKTISLDDWRALVMLADYFDLKQDMSTEEHPGLVALPTIPHLVEIVIKEYGDLQSKFEKVMDTMSVDYDDMFPEEEE